MTYQTNKRGFSGQEKQNSPVNEPGNEKREDKTSPEKNKDMPGQQTDKDVSRT